MNPLTFSAFSDELQKLAVSIAELGPAYRRLGIIRTKAKIPKPKKNISLADLADNPLSPGPNDFKAMSLAGGPFSVTPKSLIPAMKKQQGAGAEILRSAGGSAADLKEYLVSGGEAIRGAQRYGGTILSPQGGGVRAFSRGGSFGEEQAMKNLSPQGQKAVNLITGMHESYERGAKNLQPMFGHLTPEVIWKEHNLLRSLTGKGSAEGRKALQKLRKETMESEGFGRYMRAAYRGKGPEFVHGESPKITKAMRKDMRRRADEVAVQMHQDVIEEFDLGKYLQ